MERVRGRGADDEPVLSCMTLTVECDGKQITTIEALAGNFCRCISHYHVVRAVMAAAGQGR
ncbi:MAG: hypothetical protein ABSB94_03145 [Syntrophorhabdales bacterium]